MTHLQNIEALQLTALEVWSESRAALDRVLSFMTSIGFDPECKLVYNVTDLAYQSDVLAALFFPGDPLHVREALDWYRFDNMMGARGLSAGMDGDMRPITDLPALQWHLNAHISAIK